MKKGIHISYCWWVLWLWLLFSNDLAAQRTYRDTSVLASGAWYKIAVKEAGIYKVDMALLRSLGIGSAAVPSAAIRLYGNGGRMLPESCSGRVVDDLQENPIQVNDGGDGMMNGADYFLFFAAGPDSWNLDTVRNTFTHKKNLYSDQSFYFITIGGTGKRIGEVTGGTVFSQTVTSFDEHYFHELDSVNLLSSGKSWVGEEFSGGNTSRVFNLPLQNLLPGNCSFASGCASRSISSQGSFSVSINNAPVLQHAIPAVSAGNLDLFAGTSEVTNNFTLSAPAVSIRYTFQSAAFGAQGWLDWFRFTGRRSLSLAGANQLLFRDRASVVAGTNGKFVVQGAGAAAQVWDVSQPLAPRRVAALINGQELQFVNDCSELHEYIVFNNTGWLMPAAIGKINNQNLHQPSPVDMIVITHPAVYEQAARLAAYHREKDNMKVMVVNAAQVYSEFASGTPDPTALRDFVKMVHDRAASDPSKRPKYLLLFGDASYDYKNRLRNNSNFVPAYQSLISADPLATYTSDDFYGFLDDHENIGSDAVLNLLDIGIGRVPASTVTEAKAYVDKVIGYHNTGNQGAWRNRLTFVADDEDGNLHLHDAETVVAAADSTNPAFTPVKIYLDAYRQQSSSSGSRYPLVNQEINSQINAGSLIWNYSGHGSTRRLAEEVVLDQAIVASWNNAGRLPLLITATCDFAPFDNPANHSLGENILLREKTGAIALMTTTRLVFAYSNRIINRNYMQVALQRKPDGSYRSLGEAVMTAKNFTYRTFSDVINNRKFTLLGDPALTLAFPAYNVQTSTINGRQVTGLNDTLKALQQYTITGVVTGQSGTIGSSFNGTVSITVLDKAQPASTLANDPQSISENFPVQNSVLFKGKAEVTNGQFSYSFVVPKDISYVAGKGRISYYAQSNDADGNGSYTDFIIGGSQPLPADTRGPLIKAFLNNENFINGSGTDENPLLLIHLEDSSGINTAGTGIGHDITAVLDDGKQLYLLNDFFEADLNSYQKGTIRFNLYALPEGRHTLKIKAWDAANNSSEATITFTVVKKPFAILRLINFPNPVQSSTTFHFEFDAAVQRMELSVIVFTADGRRIKAIKKTIITGGSRFSDVEWDGKDDQGAVLHKGVYFYQVIAVSDSNARASKAGKLLIW